MQIVYNVNGEKEEFRNELHAGTGGRRREDEQEYFVGETANPSRPVL